MTLREPAALLALAAVVIVAAVYIVRLPFRRRYVVALPTTRALAAVAPRRPGWQRHASTVLFLAAIVATVAAFARPAEDQTVPRRLASVIVALDTSNSMRATDMKPQRLDAARQEALRFVDQVPRSAQVGLVTFSGTAKVEVPPTSDRGRFRAALNSVQFGEGTSLGEGILAALDAVEQQAAALELTQRRGGRTSSAHVPSAVVVLSDGDETLGLTGPDVVDAARRARVAVSTIAVGTKDGVVTLGATRVASPVDRFSLATVAERTHGHAFVARPGAPPLSVYDRVAAGLGSTTERRDLTGWLLGIALAFGAAALVAAFVWGQRVP